MFGHVLICLLIHLYYLDLESDPATRLLQTDTYRELLLRNRVNQAALATMPAFATGSDLDHIGVRYGIHRLTITSANGDTPAVLESDHAFRKRILLAVEGYARGGSIGWYLFNTLSSSGAVKDASIHSPSPCEIVITVLGHEGNGTASAELIDTVSNHVLSRHNRVLGDHVTVQSAEVIEYSMDASVMLYPGPSADTIMSGIQNAWAAYRTQSERIGHWISQSGVDAALHQPGVYRAIVNSPVLPLQIESHQAPYCTSFTVTEISS